LITCTNICCTVLGERELGAPQGRQYFAAIIRHDKGRYAFFVAENSEKKIVGALIGVMEQQLFSETWVATVMHVDVLPEARMGEEQECV
jgi:hypothetical protein